MEETWNKMVTRKDCLSVHPWESIWELNQLCLVYIRTGCARRMMGWPPCFRIVSASQCTLEWAPHTYPTSENSSTLPCSACWELRRHYRFACFVLKSLLWYFFPVTREEIYKCGPYCNWFTVFPLLNFPFPGGALLFFFSVVFIAQAWI